MQVRNFNMWMMVTWMAGLLLCFSTATVAETVTVDLAQTAARSSIGPAASCTDSATTGSCRQTV